MERRRYKDLKKFMYDNRINNVVIGGEIVFKGQSLQKGYPGYGKDNPCLKLIIEDFPNNTINILIFNEDAVTVFEEFFNGDYIVVTGKLSQSKVDARDINVVATSISYPTKKHVDKMKEEMGLTIDSNIEDIMKHERRKE